MTALLYIIALLWVVAGTSLIVFTERTRDIFKNIFLTEKVKRFSFLPFILGIVLIIGAFCNREVFRPTFILYFRIIGYIKRGIFLYGAFTTNQSHYGMVVL
jgi:hypothetical protein